MNRCLLPRGHWTWITFFLLTVGTHMGSFVAKAQSEWPPELRYDLAQCLSTAVHHSYALRAATENQIASEAVADAARAQRWPTLSIGADACYVSDVQAIMQPGIPPREIRLGDNEYYELFAGVQIPLYSGGSLAATERAQRAAARASAFDMAADSLRLVRDVRAGFYRALGREAELEAARLAVQRVSRHLEEIERQMQVGAATEETRLLAQSRLRSAEQRELSAHEQLSIARLRLGQLLGLPGQRVTPSGPLQDSLLSGLDEESMSEAVAERPELQALELRQLANEQQRQVAKGPLLPSIAANAQLHYGRPGVLIVDNEWMDWFSAGIQLTWTLWDWGARSARVQQTAAATRVLEHQQNDLQEQLQGALAVARERVDLARQQIDKAQERVDLERRRLTLVQGRYRQGLATETELLDVQDDLAEVEIIWAAAQAQLRVAEAELLYAVAR